MLLILYVFVMSSHVFSAVFHKVMQNLWVFMYWCICKAKIQCNNKDQQTYLSEEKISGKYFFFFLNIAKWNKTFQIETGLYFHEIYICSAS